MVKHINFEDNIFILNIRIRMVRDVLLLNSDPDLFLDKTIDDLDFTGRTLDLLLKHLVENRRLIERDEQLHNLMGAEEQYYSVLGELLNDAGAVPAAISPVQRDTVLLLQRQSQERQHTILDAFTPDENASLAPMVSSDEMSELLRDFK